MLSIAYTNDACIGVGCQQQYPGARGARFSVQAPASAGAANASAIMRGVAEPEIQTPSRSDDVVELAGTLAFSDFVRFQYSRSFRRTWWIVLVAFLIAFAGVLLAGLATVLTSDLEVIRQSGTPFLLLLVFWIVVVTAPYRGARRQIKTNVAISAPIQYIFSSRGITSTGTDFSSEISYGNLWAVLETKSLFLLYLSEGHAILLPKRFFKDGGQQDHWRSLLEQRITPKRITPVGFLGRWL